MRSTKTSAESCAYLGVDITDRYSDTPRSMDVCGLEISDDKLIPHFWAWSWGPSGSIDVTALLPEISRASAVMPDGPQGLARVGCRIRSSERSLAAAGKTADIRPPLSQPYGGFIGSSLDLFAAFHTVGLTVGSTSSTVLWEVYPAAIWTRLARWLPNKKRSAGRQARGAILKALGVVLPDAALSHDELDACAAALLGAAADGHIAGIGVAAVGDAVFWDETTGCLREGQILVPQVDSGLRGKLETVVRPWASVPAAGGPVIARPRVSAPTRLIGNGRTVVRPVVTGTREERAGELFDRLVRKLVENRPTLCTYKAAAGVVREVEGAVPDHLKEWWTQDFWPAHSADWWRRHWERTGIVDIQLADTMPDAWKFWLDWIKAVAPDNATEITALEGDAGRYLGYVRLVGRRRGEAKLEEYCWPDTMRSFPVQYTKKPVLRDQEE